MLRYWIAAKGPRPGLEFAMLTDVGRRRAHNEDVCAADESAGLFVVCDGMGGAAGGEIASHMAARVFLEQARRRPHGRAAEWRLEAATTEANRVIFEKSNGEPSLRGMGTTLVGLELGSRKGEAWLVNVGDSRCYRLRGGVLEQLTEDHSFVDEQVRLGLMTAEEAAGSHLRNIITRAVGSHAEVEADVTSHPVESGDLFLLCSDGLTRELEDEEIAGVLAAGCTGDLQACARALVQMANDSGGHDNITVVLVRV